MTLLKYQMLSIACTQTVAAICLKKNGENGSAGSVGELDAGNGREREKLCGVY